MKVTINEIISYKNEAIFERYRRDYPNNALAAEEAMKEVIKYLWLSHQHLQNKQERPQDENLDFTCGMYPEMRQIDDMWHTFLLFTREYMDFCQRYFGEFLHHAPETGEEELQAQVFEQEFSRYLSYVYDHLGEETIRVWFEGLVD